MSDILEIPTTNVSYLKYNIPENEVPKKISTSDDGYTAVLYQNSLIVGVIECDPSKEGAKYILNQDEVNMDFAFDTVITIADLDFKKSVDDKLIDEAVLFGLVLDSNVSLNTSHSKLHEQCCYLEWSPLDIVANKSFIAVLRYDGRIAVLARNKTNNRWERQFDVTDLYHKYYKNTLLKCTAECGIIKCKDACEYLGLMNDLKLIDFSWSVLVRQFNCQQYCLLATLSCTAIVTIWRIINDRRGSRCEFLYSEHLDTNGIRPLNVKICDISETLFLVTIIDSKDLIISYPYSLIVNERLTVKPFSSSFIVCEQTRHSQQTKIHWSMKLSQLIIGFEWKLLVSKITLKENDKFETESAVLYLPSDGEISGLSVKDNIAYVTSWDGFLFGIKLSLNIPSLEINQIIFKSPELNGKNEFVDVFVSPNSVYLGILRMNVNVLNMQIKRDSSIAMVCLMDENQALNILMDDNVPFSRKQDVIEEMRHLYHNMGHHLGESLKKIANSEIRWDNSRLHRLQFVRYICIFFGYKLTMDGALSGPSSATYDLSKIRELESIIVIKNISYWLDGFTELTNDGVDKDDSIFVLRVIGKLKLVPDNHIQETIEAAEVKAAKVLRSRFIVSESDIERYKDVSEDLTCPTCGDRCDFNLFVLKCSKGHVAPRCCKSLEICTNKPKKCKMCHATEKVVVVKGLSSWRLEIVNSNCPLCDGKLLNV